MQLKNTLTRYGAVAQLFHWVIVVLIITQFVLGLRADGLPQFSIARLQLLALHKSFGITVLGLAILRLIWRLFNPVPPMPPRTPRWQELAAQVSHFLLYALIFITPLLGWLMSSAYAVSVSWFKLFTLPNLIGPNKSAFEVLRESHHVVAYTLAVIALVHAAAGIKHHFVDRDDVLRRMLPLPESPTTAFVPTPNTTDTDSPTP
jgi:cytochrome b561